MVRRLTILLALFLILPATALAEFPKPTGFVNDFANAIPEGQQQQLENILSSFEKSTGYEVAVATLPSLDGRPVEDVAVDLFKTWGVGKKGKDDGVLFLVAPNERKMRIEVGYGLEGAINDAKAGRIMDEYVLPRFKSGDLSGGIAAGSIAIVKTITDSEGLSFDINAAAGTNNYSAAPVREKSSPLKIFFKIIFFIFMAILFIRHPWLFLFLLSSTGRGGSGGGGFSGGFGGFGGGMSGGGGASRGW